MQLSFSMLFAALAACLLGYVAADPLIVTDSVSGNKFYLPTGYPGTFYDAQYETIRYTYQNFTNNPTTLSSTSGVMSTRYIIINVTWAGDVSDTFTFNIPGGLTVAPLASAGSTAANCNVTTQTTLTSNNRMCIYNISWAAPLTGTFAVVYVNSSFPVGSETVAITFANNPSPAVVGDPQFVGLRGQSYQVHGIDGAVYNLITEAKTQVNSRFAFLTQGECPIIKGVAQSGCWSHPGSYMGDMSFQAIVDGKLHSALITAGSAKQGLAEVEVDGKALTLGDKVAFGAFSVSYTSTHGVAVTLENYNIELSNSDMFLNLALTAKAPLSKLTSHGLIGQTHANKVYKTSIRYIEGEVDDYLVAENDAFGTTFPFNRFQL